MTMLIVLLEEVVCAARIPKFTVVGWSGGSGHPSSEGGRGHKGAGGKDLGPESEMDESIPQPNLGTLQRP